MIKYNASNILYFMTFTNVLLNNLIANNLIIYILYFIICSIILFFIYIRLKFRFWSIQPVFHFYDLHYWMRNIGIINSELPMKNKFVNFQNIKTYTSTQLTTNQWANISTFIQLNYLRNKENYYLPKLQNITNYFIGHNYPCYWSFNMIDDVVHDSKTNSVVKNNKIIGLMSSRPLKCIINENSFDLYYVDYLCVDKKHRKQNIAPQIIQTHEYNQSHSNKKICVSLFKREEDLTGIIPLTCYDTYCYNLNDFVHNNNAIQSESNINVLTCDKQNIYYFYHFMKEYSHKWNIYIFPTISNLYNLIESKNIIIKMLTIDKEIISAYIFKKTCTYLEKNKEVLSCIASINGNYLNKDEFIDGFMVSIKSILENEYKEEKIKKEISNFCFLSIENISDNCILNTFTESLFQSKTAYFFYNFAHSPFKSNKCFIIN
jgi:hypothetical protein